MIKKAFTLIELMIVILVIGILFLSIWFLSWSYVHKLNIQNDTQIIENVFLETQNQSLSQPLYKNDLLSKLWVKLFSGKKYLIIMWATWGNTFLPLKIKNLSYLVLSWGINYNWSYYWSWIIYFNSYKIWANLLVSDGIFSTGEVKLEFSDVNWDMKRCFKLNLNVGRLYLDKCN